MLTRTGFISGSVKPLFCSRSRAQTTVTLNTLIPAVAFIQLNRHLFLLNGSDLNVPMLMSLTTLLRNSSSCLLLNVFNFQSNKRKKKRITLKFVKRINGTRFFFKYYALNVYTISHFPFPKTFE